MTAHSIDCGRSFARASRGFRDIPFLVWAVIGAFALTAALMTVRIEPEPPWTPEEAVYKLVGRLDRFSGGPADRWPDRIVGDIEGRSRFYISPVNGAVLTKRMVHDFGRWTDVDDFSIVARSGDCVVVRWRTLDM